MTELTEEDFIPEDIAATFWLLRYGHDVHTISEILCVSLKDANVLVKKAREYSQSKRLEKQRKKAYEEGISMEALDKIEQSIKELNVIV